MPASSADALKACAAAEHLPTSALVRRILSRAVESRDAPVMTEDQVEEIVLGAICESVRAGLGCPGNENAELKLGDADDADREFTGDRKDVGGDQHAGVQDATIHRSSQGSVRVLSTRSRSPGQSASDGRAKTSARSSQGRHARGVTAVGRIGGRRRSLRVRSARVLVTFRDWAGTERAALHGHHSGMLQMVENLFIILVVQQVELIIIKPESQESLLAGGADLHEVFCLVSLAGRLVSTQNLIFA